MKKLTYLLTFLLFITSTLPSLGQPESAQLPQFPAKAVLEDAEVLENLLKSYHSGLFWYMPETQFENKVRDIKSQIREGMTELEIYQLFNPLIADINCGHTNLRPSKEFYRHSAEHFRYFPALVRIIQERVYLDRQFAQRDHLPKGTEIISINGKPVSEIIDLLLPQMTSDGEIKTAKYRELEYWFPLFYSRFIGQPDTFRVEVQLPGLPSSVKIDLPAVSWDKIKLPEEDALPVNFEILPAFGKRSRVGLLTLKSFDEEWLEEEKIDFPKYLEKTFQKIAQEQLKTVVIDLRGNYGGNDSFGSHLFAYLAREPFRYYASIQMTAEVKGSIPPSQRKELTLEKRDGRFYYTNHPALGTTSPQKNAFDGELYVLTDGGSFSATAGFAAMVHQYKRGMLLGEETGGAYAGNTSGFMLDATLPNTGMRLIIPAFQYQMAVMEHEPAGRGVIPDYRVSPSVEDWLSGKDRVLEYTLQLIGRESVALLNE